MSTPDATQRTKIEELATQRPKIEELMREMRLKRSFDSLFSQAVAERVGMHQTDIETMDLLDTLGPMTAGELSERTGLTSGATTRLIDRLQRAGYVRRCPDESDRRCVIIEPLHENLHQQLKPLYQPMADAMADLWSRLSDKELEVIIAFLRRHNAVVADINARMRTQARVESSDNSE